MKLSKNQSEMLGSRLKKDEIFTKACTYCNHHSQFSEENGLVFGNEISSSMETFGTEHNSTKYFFDMQCMNLIVVVI